MKVFILALEEVVGSIEIAHPTKAVLISIIEDLFILEQIIIVMDMVMEEVTMATLELESLTIITGVQVDCLGVVVDLLPLVQVQVNLQ